MSFTPASPAMPIQYTVNGAPTCPSITSRYIKLSHSRHIQEFLNIPPQLIQKHKTMSAKTLIVTGASRGNNHLHAVHQIAHRS